MLELASDRGAIPAGAASDYQRDGFYLAPPGIEKDLVSQSVEHMDKVIAGEYETGSPPKKRLWNPGDDPNRICKINDPHLADHTLYKLVTSPRLGEWAAAITGARRVQVWTTQLLYKPPSRTQSGNVGWHQDREYWPYWNQEDGLFTAWIALGDVDELSGPVQYVAKSHTWGLLGQGDFFEEDREAGRANFRVPPGKSWHEVSAVLPAGGAVFHHCLTLHGSGPNLSDRPRRSMAVHLRTEKIEPNPEADHYYVSHLDDPRKCPVIFEA